MKAGGERDVPGELRARLAAMPDAARSGALLAHVRARAAHFLQLEDVAAVAPARSWLDLGFDSLRAVDFRGELAADLGLALRSTLLFDHPTPRALTAHLLELLVSVPAAAPAPGTTANVVPGAEPIAIVGAACQFPGGESLEEFWRLLVEGRDAIVPIPRERFDVEALFDPDPAAEGKLYVREAGLLRTHDQFDAACFGISPREALMLDPQQRMLLETSLHALEHANLPSAALAGQRVGVYVGTRASEYFDSQTTRSPTDATTYYPTGNAVSTAAGRISYTFGFQGPCYALDTACSGSLVAVHIAVRALRARECDAALAGGVNSIYDPVPMAGLCRARMLAPDGRCKSFDQSANGYGRGEGCGIVVLKRLADARAAGDRILAVVRGTSINQDGRSGGLTVPHGPSQTAVIRAALADAGVGVDAIDYVEAHGTGTALGDPIEVGALDAAFAGRSRPLPIGSVKTNIGHLEAAAGISGLLKVMLALRARTLPATLHFRVPNPHIDWTRSIVRVVAERTPLPASGELLAGISSFGFSGTNCHVVIGAAPEPAAAPSCAPVCSSPVAQGPWLLPLQAVGKDALRALAAAHADALVDAAHDLAAWCHSAAVGRADASQRAAFIASDRDRLVAALRAFAAGDDGAATAVGQAAAAPPPVAFLFPGQGAQRAGMGRQLSADEPVFADALAAAGERLADLLPAPLPELLFGNATGLLDRTDCTQPALCAYELALLALFRSVGVVPDAVIGHSIGDYPAAVAAGVMDGSDALRLCAARGRLMVERCRPGGMLAVLAPTPRWQHLLAAHPRATIAVRNADANVVIGGDGDELALLQQRLEAAGIPSRRLPVSHAFHTANTEPMLAEFAALVAGVRLRPPERTFVDCRKGALGTAAIATAEHWCAHVREPVEFAQGLRTLGEGPTRVWIELGPVPMLAALARGAAERGVRVIPAQRAEKAGRTSFLFALAEAWTLGVAVDLAAANHGSGPPRATLPSYPFQRQRFWLERKAPMAGVGNPGATAHPLLGARLESSVLGLGQAVFQAQVSQGQPPWLNDHQAMGQVLLPAAGMLEIALAAEAALGSPLPLVVRGASLRSARELEATAVLLELTRTAEADGAARFSLSSRGEDGTWRTHLEGRSATASNSPPPRVDLAAIAARCPASLTAEQLYARAETAQLQYGPAFRLVRTLRHGAHEVLTTVELPATVAAAPFVLHPALLDACFHGTIATMADGQTPLLPIGVEELVVYRRGVQRASCHLRRRVAVAPSHVTDLDLYDDDGNTIAAVRGLQLVPADRAALRDGRSRELLHHVAWDLLPPPSPSPPPSRVAIVGHPELATALAARLPVGGAVVVTPAALPAALLAQRLDAIVLLATEAFAGAPMAIQERVFGDALLVVQTLLRAGHGLRTWSVTHGTFAAAPAPAGTLPHAAVLHGLLRTLALEHPSTRPVRIDLDPTLPIARLQEHAAAIAAELRTSGDEPEVALRSGQRRAPRLRRGGGPADRMPIPAFPFRVRTTAYGPFEHLACLPQPRRAPVGDEIEVAMTAAALNFKDVLHARGLLRSFAESAGIVRADQQPLGFEGCGIVAAAGDAVSTLRVGDRVVVQAENCLASHVTLPASAAFVVPAGVDPVAAAGVPIVFATVLHALTDLAQVARGETVLVHAAAGGVGQAAIALLRATGCRVLATASAGKRAFVQDLGVEVVGDTRGADFTAAVRAATAGRGVDVVLNTLSGDAVGKSLQVLATGGRFVELGKLGVWTAAQVHAVRPDVKFFAFDLGDEFRRDPTLQARLLARVRDGLAEGTLRPPTATVVPLAAVRTAFHHLSKGQHVGKVIVRLPDRLGDALPAERTLVLTGATGGTTPAIANALVDAGAKNLALLARGEVPVALLTALRERGASVLAVRADVTDRAALATALHHVRATMPPIGGIVHAAGALADAVLTGLDAGRALAALAPKVAGALWLDELTAGDPVEFFVLTSSMASTLGNPGQAAYAAANSFLDAFAAWRRAHGRPATAIAFGPWDGGGMASRLDERLRARLQQMGVSFVPAATAARLLVQQRDPGHDLAVLPVRWADWLLPFGDAVPRLLLALKPAANKTAAIAALDLRGLPANARRPALRAAVRTQVATVLGFAEAEQLAAERTFRDLGLDSLLAVDAKDRLERLLGITLPATLLFDQPDLDRLVDHLHELLFPAPAVATAVPAAEADFEQMATEDLAKALADELRDYRERP